MSTREETMSGLQLSRSGDGTAITASWSGVPTMGQLEVSWRSGSYDAATAAFTPDFSWNVAPRLEIVSTQTMVTIPGLNPQKDYEVQVVPVTYGTNVLSAVAPVVPPSPPPPAAAPISFGRVTYNYKLTNTPVATTAARYSLMVMQSTDSPTAHQIKTAAAALGKNLPILMYQEPTNCNVTGDPNGMTHMLPGSEFNSAWALKDSSGANLMWGPGVVMDCGNSAYLQASLAHMTSLCKTLGFDGIFLDDFTRSVPGGGTSPRYPTLSAWQTMMATVCAPTLANGLRAAGLMAMANVAGGIPSYWQMVGQHIDHLEEESWTDGGAGAAQQVPYFAAKLANLVWAEAHGVTSWVHTYGTSQAANVYALCAALLAANGHTIFCVSSGGGQSINTNEFWFPEFDQALALGAPVSAYSKLPSGLYARVFQGAKGRGVVLVNATLASITDPTYGVVPATSGQIH